MPAVQIAQLRPDAGQILEQQRDRAPPPARPEQDVLPHEEQPRPALRGSTSMRVTVKQFKIFGNHIYTDAELQPTLASSLGKELDFEGLNEAANSVRAYYRANGYFLAQAYLPAQQIKDGVVEIAVLEGLIGTVELKPDANSRLRPDFARGVLDAHLRQGDPITERGLERPLLLLSDLPNVVVSSEIGPSTKSIGAADLRVHLKESGRLVSGYADLDNAGNRYTGEWRTGVNVNVNNLSGYGDQLTARATLTNERMTFMRGAVSVPVGYGGFRVGASYAEFYYTLEKDFAALKAHGEGSVTSLYGLYPFIRTRNANLIGQVSYETKLLKDRIDTSNSLEDRKIDTFKLGLVGDVRDRVFGGALNSFAVTYTEGVLVINPAAVAIADQGVTGLRTQGKFGKVNFDVRRLQLITENINLLVALNGQLTNKNLASAEKMSLGGATGVRAYPTGQGIGDQGFIFSTELRYNVPKFQLFSGDVTFLGFYDAGRVKVNYTPLATSVSPNFVGLSSVGVGISVGKDNDFLVKTSIAWRGENDNPDADNVRREPRVWFQAIKWF
ncbi:MAG: ShlB/FhaC/HecB family hemolysin secretion/activation protein [Betaproteobacteria bacterium]